MPEVKNERYFNKNWTSGTYGLCQEDAFLGEGDIFCVKSTEYQESYPYVSLFQCASNTTSSFLQYVFIETKHNKPIISSQLDCIVEGAYDAIDGIN